MDSFFSLILSIAAIAERHVLVVIEIVDLVTGDHPSAVVTADAVPLAACRKARIAAGDRFRLVFRYLLQFILADSLYADDNRLRDLIRDIISQGERGLLTRLPGFQAFAVA